MIKGGGQFALLKMKMKNCCSSRGHSVLLDVYRYFLSDLPRTSLPFRIPLQDGH